MTNRLKDDLRDELLGRVRTGLPATYKELADRLALAPPSTIHRITEHAAGIGYEMIGVGVPKTVDNDLAVTDCCPGFGSVAKYVATSMREAAFDVASMAKTSTCAARQSRR